MSGKELFLKYTSKRDYSGSDADKYARLLFTILYQIKGSIYGLLEEAEAKKKKLAINPELPDFIDEYSIEDIIFV